MEKVSTAELTKELWIGERLYWDHAPEDERQEHIARYQFARDRFQSSWHCVDAACGSGYGTHFLAQKVKSVRGFDISEHAIAYAAAKYISPAILFDRADLESKLPIASASVDAITSFETLEHVRQQRRMLGEFQRILKPGGLLMISTPDRDVHALVGGNKNEFHVAELTKNEFLDLLSEFFVVAELYGHSKYQPVAGKWRAVHGVLRGVSKLDKFGWKESAVNALRMHGAVRSLRRRFWPMAPTSLERVPLDAGPNNYAYLVAVAEKSR